MLKSLKTRIMLTVTVIVILLLTIIITFFAQRAKVELSLAFEDNAINMIEATRLHVESEYNNILYYKSVMLDRRKNELMNNTIIAFSIINSAYKDYQDKLISESLAKTRVMEILKLLRYDNDVGYFWINDDSRPYPTMIMHPTIPALDGQVMDSEEYNVTLDTNESLFKAFVDVALEHGDGYVEYLWPKPTPEGLTEQQPKVSYVRLFEEWHWIIGTGLYIDDIEKDVQNRIDVAVKGLNNIIGTQRIGESGYFFIFDDNEQILVHPTLAGTDGSVWNNIESGKPLLKELMEVAFLPENCLSYIWDRPENPEEYKYLKKTYVTYYEPLGWYIASSVYNDDLEQKISKFSKFIINFSVVFFIVSVFLAFLISRTITKPLSELVISLDNIDASGIPKLLPEESGITEIDSLQSTINNMVKSIDLSRRDLKDAHQELASVLEYATLVSIISTTPEGVIKIFSAGAEILTGYLSNEMVDKQTPHILHLESEMIDHGKRLSDEYGRTIDGFDAFIVKAKEGGYEEREWTYVKKDGSHIKVNLGITAIKNESGIITGYLGVASDITKRKEAEDDLKLRTNELDTALIELKEHEEHLEELVENRTIELQNSLDELKKTQKKLIESEKMASLGGLVAGVAHEINTPVGSGITLASHLEAESKKIADKYDSDTLSKKDFEEFLDLVKESPKMILFNLNRAADLVQSFKNVAVDQSLDVKRSFNIEEYISEILVSLGSKFRKSNILVDINCPDTLIVDSYPGAYYRIMTNLLLNSLKHGFDEVDEGKISINVKLIDSNIIIDYTDDGIGMSDAEVSRIFEPFYTTKRGKGGTGLGLNIVYNIVYQTLKGEIECKSVVGKGTTFIIKIPYENG